MKSEKKSSRSKPSNLRRSTQRWTPLVIIGVIAVGIAGSAWVAKLRRPSMSTTPGSPARAPSAPTVSISNRPPSFSTNLTAPLGDQTNDPLRILNAGNELLDQGDLDGAIAHYLNALKLSPEDEEVHFNLAFAFGKQGKYNEAIRYYNEALRIFPDYAEAHNNLGNIFVALRRYDEAATHFSAALKINPDSSSVLNNLGRCLAELGQTSAAIVQFGEAIRLNPNYLEAYFNLGNAHLILGNTDQGVRAFEQALKINPAFAPAIKSLERVRAKQGGGLRPR